MKQTLHLTAGPETIHICICMCFHLFLQAMVTRGGKISYYLVFHILSFSEPVVQYAQVWGLVFNLEQFCQVMGVICFSRQVAICI